MPHSYETRSGFTPTGRLHFGVNLVGPASELSFEQLRTLAQTAERGLFTLVTLDERYWLPEDPGAASTTDPAGSNDVATLLAALTAVTSNIGVAVAAAPDYDDPTDLAHRIASLDKLSGGRAAWQLLADGARHGRETADPDAAGPDTVGPDAAGPDAAGPDADQPDAEGIASADGRHGFVESVQRTWEAWEKPASGEAGPVETLGAFERGGQLYSVGLGALRSTAPRRSPVLIHAGGTSQERAFAVEHADIVTSAPANLGDALALRRDMVARSLDSGGANHVKIFQSATFILAPTEEEAVEKADWIRAHLPDSVWDRQAFIGSYSGVADLLQDFARSGAVDGFTLMPWLFPDELADIVNYLIPELQARGIYPSDYDAGTLRSNLGLPEGSSRGNRATHALPVIEVGDLGDVRLDLDLRMELIVQKLQA